MGIKISEQVKIPLNKLLRAVRQWWMWIYRLWVRRPRWGERGIQFPMSLAVIFWALIIGGVATGSYLVIYHWVLTPRVEPVADSVIVSMALTIAAGTGGLVLLVVNYRKQHDLEESRFVDRFGAATAQLGHEDVAVRLAGVYALAGVAERARYRGQIQQCIDVLCGYLRLPYDPNAVETHQTSKVIKRPGRDAANFAREKHYKYRQNDEVVRQTVVTVIVAHLQRKARYKWSTYDFNFTGVYFEDAKFDGVRFSGERTSFDHARFSGDRTSFDHARFSGERTSFDHARFSGDRTSFDHARFSGEMTLFENARFSGEWTEFYQARFSGEWTWFGGARFSGDRTSFDQARFSGEWTLFDQATFSADRTSFDQATFSADRTSFYQARFSGGWTSFDQATFSGGWTRFNQATFSGKYIDFSAPQQWNPAPTFDWDAPESGILKPDNVKPDDWPPKEKRVPVPGDS